MSEYRHYIPLDANILETWRVDRLKSENIYILIIDFCFFPKQCNLKASIILTKFIIDDIRISPKFMRKLCFEILN